jgi:uncharacterized protein (TIGR00730 family)
MTSMICVYCGSRSGQSPAYEQAAADVGSALARHGLGLVYGGGNVGLMGVLADAVLAGGGRVVGVIPERLERRDVAHRGLHELIVVEDMHQRKAAMAARAAAFVALPGGFGTLEELFEAVAWSQLGYHDKPVAVLNTLGYYDHLLAFLDHATDQHFLHAHHRPLVRVAHQVGELMEDLLGALGQD